MENNSTQHDGPGVDLNQVALEAFQQVQGQGLSPQETFEFVAGAIRGAAQEAGLPQGVRIKTAYDRSGLILRAIDNLKRTLIEESIIVALVCVIFLFHFRSALVGIFTLPVGVLISFIIMERQGINANIMSLGGIAIAIGAMVDAAIVMIVCGVLLIFPFIRHIIKSSLGKYPKEI